MSDGMRRELAYLSSHATNRYFIPNWGKRYQILRLHIDDSLTKCSPLLHIYTTNLV